MILLSLFLTIVIFHLILHLTNPYAKYSIFKRPYDTFIKNNQILYKQNYRPKFHTSHLAHLLGYYKSGFLIAQNTLIGGKEPKTTSSQQIINEIHSLRFDPRKSFLISGDQFSVLYPRNLGVFYNQLLDPNIAHSHLDWQNRQKIYLQSVLIAIDGLASHHSPRTTLVPLGPRSFTLTQVHPGSVGSDQVFGVLYALNTMLDQDKVQSRDGQYVLQTQDSAKKILNERKDQLRYVVSNYKTCVQDPESGLVKSDIKLSSARDGVTRSSSFYDNIILWKTLNLALKLNLATSYNQKTLESIKTKLKKQYWNEKRGYYADDLKVKEFSSDWLIGFPAEFFDLSDPVDLKRTIKTVDYIESSDLVRPFPIKYQMSQKTEVPFFVKLGVPSYGGEAIWSYWGSEYITLLLNLYQKTSDKKYLKKSKIYLDIYEKNIIRDKGFAETYDPNGNFLRSGLYKSIRNTGWVTQFEHAKDLYRTLSK